MDIMNIRSTIPFLILSVMSSIGPRKTIVGMIEHIGIDARHYPKRYVTPKRWIMRLFSIEPNRLNSIPRFLYIQLYLSLFFALLGPINIIIYVSSDYNPKVAGILLLFHCFLLISEMIYAVTMWLVFTKTGKRKSRTD